MYRTTFLQNSFPETAVLFRKPNSATNPSSPLLPKSPSWAPLKTFRAAFEEGVLLLDETQTRHLKIYHDGLIRELDCLESEPALQHFNPQRLLDFGAESLIFIGTLQGHTQPVVVKLSAFPLNREKPDPDLDIETIHYGLLKTVKGFLHIQPVAEMNVTPEEEVAFIRRARAKRHPQQMDKPKYRICADLNPSFSQTGFSKQLGRYQGKVVLVDTNCLSNYQYA